MSHPGVGACQRVSIRVDACRYLNQSLTMATTLIDHQHHTDIGVDSRVSVGRVSFHVVACRSVSMRVLIGVVNVPFACCSMSLHVGRWVRVGWRVVACRHESMCVDTCSRSDPTSTRPCGSISNACASICINTHAHTHSNTHTRIFGVSTRRHVCERVNE